jgi:hypothetical protein
VSGNTVLVMRIVAGQAPEAGNAPDTEAYRKGELKGGKALAELWTLWNERRVVSIFDYNRECALLFQQALKPNATALIRFTL